VPRREFGDYLQALQFWHVQPLGDAGRVKIDVIEHEVLDVFPGDRGANLILKNSGTVQAERVLLATGNLPPRDVVPPGTVQDHPAYCRNPWRDWHSRLPDPREDVVLAGTGLTMIEVFLTLSALGWKGTIYGVSRNGLVPLPHFKGSDYPQYPPDQPWNLGLAGLAALVEEHCARLRAAGQNPALAVDKLRPFTHRIWRTFSLAEKQEFCQRYRARWNVVRHRIPPAVAAQIETAQKEGRLHVIRGQIGAVQSDDARIRVTIAPGNGQPSQELLVGLLVNCTGARESFSDAPEALFRNLFQRGLVRPDELDMGIDATPDFAVVDQQGRPSGFLFAVGPLLKGTLWETVAVPELRAQAHQVAQAILADDQARHPDWAPETPVDLVEYYI
jgi:uncharacterized NAD(P)/FAD-binding protein YdhS